MYQANIILARYVIHIQYIEHQANTNQQSIKLLKKKISTMYVAKYNSNSNSNFS